MAKISNFTLIFVTISILVVVVITTSTIRINREHEEKLMYAMESKVEYYARKCYLENNCRDTITLKTLYDLGYLKEVVNPVTKEVVDYNTTITYEKDVININWQ